MQRLFVVLLSLTALSAALAAEPRPITVAVGQEFEIILESPPGNNNQWLLAKPLDAQRLKPLGRKYRKQTGEGARTRNYEVLRYQALADGTTQIFLRYAPPWEGSHSSTTSTNFVVVITGTAAKPPRQR